MSTDEIINIVYNYAQKACHNTLIDYRDVAHIVFVRHLEKFENGRVRHVKAYVYLAIKCIIINIYKAEYKYNIGYDMDMFTVHETRKVDIACDIEKIFEKLSHRERIIVKKSLAGYDRKQIASMLSLTRLNIDIIWFRMIRKLRKSFCEKRRS